MLRRGGTLRVRGMLSDRHNGSAIGGSKLPTPEEVQRQRVLRSRFLSALYDMEAESRRPNGYVDVRRLMSIIAPEGLEGSEIARLIRELSSSHLIEVPRGSQSLQDLHPRLVGLTSFGRDEVERWVERGDEPTAEIPVPYNVIYNTTNVQNAYGSQFVTGSTGTTISIQNRFGSDLTQIAANLRQILGQVNGLSRDEREDMENAADSLDEQAAEATPNESRIRSVLRQVGRWLAPLAAATQTGLAAGLSAETQELVTHAMGQLG